MGQLNQLYEIHGDACLWLLKYLTSHTEIFTNIILVKANSEIRESLRILVDTAI